MSDIQKKIQDNMSIFNPTDAAMMKQNGQLDPNMSIRDFFQMNGVDVDGPISQLVKFAQDQIGKANPLNKMQAIAGQGPMQQPQGQPQGLPQGQEQGSPDLNALLSGLQQ